MKTKEDLLKDIKKVKGPRNHKLSGGYTTWDFFRYYEKSGGKLPPHEYLTIIKTINDLAKQKLLECGCVELPLGIGKLEVIKIKTSSDYHKKQIDWERTVNLWCEDQEALNERFLVRNEEDYIFKIVFTKGKTFKPSVRRNLMFSPTRTLKRLLKEGIKSGDIDALIR